MRSLGSKCLWLTGALFWTAATMAWAQPGTFQPGNLAASDFYGLELEHGNGDKIVRGPMNLMHIVFRRGLWYQPTSTHQIIYRSSGNGQTWTPEISLGSGSLPAVAVDHLSRIGVVFVRNGQIHYGYKTLGQTSFTVASLNQVGTDPAIVGHGSQVYVSWTTGTAVRYTSFPTVSPPVVASFETIDQTTCPNTQFSRTSIALVGDICTKAVWPVVAYLVSSDEQNSLWPCQAPYTLVGPAVVERQPANGWTNIFTDFGIDWFAAPGSMRPISLSLSAHTYWQDIFLTWSDEQSSWPRTMLAKGRFGNFVAVPVSWTASHTHVRAANDLLLPFGRFRLTGVDEYVFQNNPFQNFTGFVREGIWGNAAAPLWNATSHNLSTPIGLPARPQALYWETLTSSFQRRQAMAFYERELQGERLGLYEPPLEPWGRRRGLDCIKPNGNDNPINLAARTISGAGGETTETWVDLGATGRVIDVSDTGLEVQLVSGGTVQVTWPESAHLLSAFEDGFVVATNPASVTFSSDDATFEIIDQGELPADPVFATLTCDAELGECP